MVVIDKFRFGHISEVTDKMLMDLNFWYNKERSRVLAEFRELEKKYGLFELPKSTFEGTEGLASLMLVNELIGEDLEKQIEEVQT